MSITLRELVRDQIMAEGPQMEGVEARERYINEQLRYMPHSELLERISDALQHGIRVQWLFGAGT